MITPRGIIYAVPRKQTGSQSTDIEVPVPEEMLEFPDRLRRVRKDAGLTQQELAARSGVAQGQISNYEKRRRWPSAAAVVRLAAALGVSTDRLLTGKRVVEGSPVVDAETVEMLRELVRQKAADTLQKPRLGPGKDRR